MVFAALLTLLIRVGHPPVVDEDEPLGLARILVAIIGLLIFVLSFIDNPDNNSLIAGCLAAPELQSRTENPNYDSLRIGCDG